MTPQAVNCIDYLKPKELASMINVPEGTLRYWRYIGSGPDFVRMGGRIRYNRGDVQRWLHERRQVSSVRAAVEARRVYLPAR
jgi:predicted site-specific integrase-resolvase